MVKYLFERGADANMHTTNDGGATPLCCASSNGHLDVVKYLMEHGVDADSHRTTDNGATPFGTASSN